MADPENLDVFLRLPQGVSLQAPIGIGSRVPQETQGVRCLVCVDGSSMSEPTVREALDALDASDDALIVLHVEKSGRQGSGRRVSGKKILRDLESKLLAPQAMQYELMHVKSNGAVAVSELIDHIADVRNVDLVVMGTYGLSRESESGDMESRLSSTAFGVITSRHRHTTMIVKSSLGSRHSSGSSDGSAVFACCVDGSQVSMDALGTALHLARKGDKVLAVSVHEIHVDTTHIEAKVEEVVAAETAAREDGDANMADVEFFGLDATGRKTPGETIVDFSVDHNIQYIVIGSVGINKADEEHLGSTGKWIARKAKCTVVIVKPIDGGDDSMVQHHSALCRRVRVTE